MNFISDNIISAVVQSPILIPVDPYTSLGLVYLSSLHNFLLYKIYAMPDYLIMRECFVNIKCVNLSILAAIIGYQST